MIKFKTKYTLFIRSPFSIWKFKKNIYRKYKRIICYFLFIFTDSLLIN